MVAVKPHTEIILPLTRTRPVSTSVQKLMLSEPHSLGKGITDYCVGRDTDSQQSRQNFIFLPGDERSGYFCHRKGGQRAEEGQRARGEPSPPTLPLGEAPSPPAPALQPTQAQEHGGKPRCRTSDRPSRLQSLFATSRHLLLLLMLCFAYPSSWPL